LFAGTDLIDTTDVNDGNVDNAVDNEKRRRRLLQDREFNAAAS